MYLHGLYQLKSQIEVYFPGFGKYWAKTGQFLPKMGPETLNRNISKTHFRIELEKETS